MSEVTLPNISDSCESPNITSRSWNLGASYEDTLTNTVSDSASTS